MTESSVTSPAGFETQWRRLPASHLYLSAHTQTPLIPIERPGVAAPIWCKLEFLNPSGSIKDRIASFILLKAFREGAIEEGSYVVEASSGSTSISLAMLCSQLGVKFVAVMPEGVTRERTMMIRALGGEVHLVPGPADLTECQKIAERLSAELRGFLPRQFENEDNANAHRYGTAREVLEQIPGSAVHAVVAGVGTGGTLVGLHRGMRDAGCDPGLCAAKPVSLHARKHDCCAAGECFCEIETSSFSRRIPGVVENMSGLFSDSESDALKTVEIDEDAALEMTRELNRLGFPVGPSSGLNLAAAEAIANELGSAANVVTVFPDRMERYLSTELFDEPEPAER